MSFPHKAACTTASLNHEARWSQKWPFRKLPGLSLCPSEGAIYCQCDTRCSPLSDAGRQRPEAVRSASSSSSPYAIRRAWANAGAKLPGLCSATDSRRSRHLPRSMPITPSSRSIAADNSSADESNLPVLPRTPIRLGEQQILVPDRHRVTRNPLHGFCQLRLDSLEPSVPTDPALPDPCPRTHRTSGHIPGLPC